MLATKIEKLFNMYKNFNLKLFVQQKEDFIWTLLGFGFSNMLRLLSSLILTRIFMPEQFGLMAILISLYVGAELLSDVGIQTSIIRNENDKDRPFLETAWTLCVIRGFILCIAFSLSAGFFADLFNAPIFKEYLPVFSLIFIVKGFKSTSLFLHMKHRKVKILTKLELSIQMLSLLTTVSLATYFESLWAFIFAMIFSETVHILATHYYLKGGIVGFSLSKLHVNGLIRFGKWLFFASVLTFITGQGDRFLLGLYFTKENLGIYHVAATLAILPIMLHNSLINKILFPTICSKLSLPTDDFNLTFNSLRKKVVLISFPIAIAFCVFGQYIINFLYDKNYENAGYMLQILSIGAMFKILADSITPILNAKGDSFRHMQYVGFSAALLILGIVIGNHLYQLQGILFSIAIVPLFSLLFVMFLAKKYVDINHKITLLFVVITFVMMYYTINR